MRSGGRFAGRQPSKLGFQTAVHVAGAHRARDVWQRAAIRQFPRFISSSTLVDVTYVGEVATVATLARFGRKACSVASPDRSASPSQVTRAAARAAAAASSDGWGSVAEGKRAGRARHGSRRKCRRRTKGGPRRAVCSITGQRPSSPPSSGFTLRPRGARVDPGPFIWIRTRILRAPPAGGRSPAVLPPLASEHASLSPPVPRFQSDETKRDAVEP